MGERAEVINKGGPWDAADRSVPRASFQAMRDAAEQTTPFILKYMVLQPAGAPAEFSDMSLPDYTAGCAEMIQVSVSLKAVGRPGIQRI